MKLVKESAVSPSVVAEQILHFREDQDTTPMQIIKLTYLCHGWMLGIDSRYLINEAVRAWRYGPVIPSLYQTYKAFGRNPIDTVPRNRTNMLDEDQNVLIKAVLDAYREYDGIALSSITHQPGTPWDKVYRNGKGEDSIIPNKLIAKHYKARFEGTT